MTVIDCGNHRLKLMADNYKIIAQFEAIINIGYALTSSYKMLITLLHEIE